MYINFTITREYTLESDTLSDFAKMLGVRLSEARKIVAGDDEYTPNHDAEKRLIDNAELNSDEFTIDEVGD